MIRRRISNIAMECNRAPADTRPFRIIRKMQEETEI